MIFWDTFQKLSWNYPYFFSCWKTVPNRHRLQLRLMWCHQCWHINYFFLFHEYKWKKYLNVKNIFLHTSNLKKHFFYSSRHMKETFFFTAEKRKFHLACHTCKKNKNKKLHNWKYKQVGVKTTEWIPGLGSQWMVAVAPTKVNLEESH